jgi:hypothetical protein
MLGTSKQSEPRSALTSLSGGLGTLRAQSHAFLPNARTGTQRGPGPA